MIGELVGELVVPQKAIIFVLNALGLIASSFSQNGELEFNSASDTSAQVKLL